MARVSMWPMWGLPLAVGGPSKKDQTSRPSRFFMDFWKMSLSFQNLMTSFSRARKSSAVETFSIIRVFLPSKIMRLTSPWDEGASRYHPN